MARPLRFQLAGAVYHGTARGNDRRSLFLGNIGDGRTMFLDILGWTDRDGTRQSACPDSIPPLFGDSGIARYVRTGVLRIARTVLDTRQLRNGRLAPRSAR